MSTDQQEPGSNSLVKWLSQPASYPARPSTVETVETHISWVFLTPELVFKLKKPVRFDFLDFSTAEKRKAACEEELRLNRRMAPGVYLQVLPVRTEGENGFSFDGDGPPADWLVQMKRLPGERMLDEQIRRQTLSAAEIDKLARMLAEFYQQAAAVEMMPEEYRSAYEQRVLATAKELSDPRHVLDPVRVERVNTAQQRFLWLSAGMLRERVAGGRVIEGHGDLRPEHVCLVDPPAVFDCIEFNAAFRRIDVADELSFLAMECDRLERPEIGQAVLARWQRLSHDQPAPALLNFYKAYRASVRSKVAALRASEHAGRQQETDSQEASEYLTLADRYVAALPRAPLVLVRGISGAGKSTLAASLVKRLGARWLRTDEIRREVVGHLSSNERYRPESRAAVYDEVFRRAGDALRQGLMVLLDGTFLEREQRRRAAVLAETQGIGCLQLHCTVTPAIAKQRIAARLAKEADASEATPELVDRQLSELEADDESCPPTETLDSALTAEEHVRRSLDVIAAAQT
jgi:aminoglycoside phosphotransferase family enzyme/predicted kinase